MAFSLIAGYPTIKLFHVSGGKLVSSDYSGGRSAAEIVKGALAEAAKVALGRIGAKASGGGGGRASGVRQRQQHVFRVLMTAVTPVSPHSSIPIPAYGLQQCTLLIISLHSGLHKCRWRGSGWLRGWRRWRRRRAGSV